MLEHLAGAAPSLADPMPVAELVLSIIESPAPRLRYAAGNQAVEVVARLATLDDGSRQRYARAVTDLDWWHEGGAPESKKV
jgi:hypothetical protein